MASLLFLDIDDPEKSNYPLAIRPGTGYCPLILPEKGGEDGAARYGGEENTQDLADGIRKGVAELSSVRKESILEKIKKISKVCGGLLGCVAQIIPRIDAEILQKGGFRAETHLRTSSPLCLLVLVVIIPAQIKRFIIQLAFGKIGDKII